MLAATIPDRSKSGDVPSPTEERKETKANFFDRLKRKQSSVLLQDAWPKLGGASSVYEEGAKNRRWKKEDVENNWLYFSPEQRKLLEEVKDVPRGELGKNTGVIGIIYPPREMASEFFSRLKQLPSLDPKESSEEQKLKARKVFTRGSAGHHPADSTHPSPYSKALDAWDRNDIEQVWQLLNDEQKSRVENPCFMSHRVPYTALGENIGVLCLDYDES